MPSYLKKRSMNYHIFGLMGVTVVILGIIAYYNWLLSLAGFFLSGSVILFYFDYSISRQKKGNGRIYCYALLSGEKGRRRSIDGNANWNHAY